ncbi:MAG: PKD domain-containing protein [Chitinophagaceae bacterium]
MKRQYITGITGMVFGALTLFLFSCKKYEVKSLGPNPAASFTVTAISGQVNKYLLTSTSSNSYRYDWDKATGTFMQGKMIDTVYFPDAGTYTVKLRVFGQSGIDSASKQIVVAADDPAAITPFKILTGNNTRRWKLAPEAGALWIGPADFSQTWWQNSVADVTTRSCHFNDEYTFVKAGSVMQFDGKNDIWVDEEAGNPWPAGMPPVGCYASNAIPAQFQPWSMSANFTFEVINNNKLKVIGLGAHLGLYKAATPPDAAVATPQSSVTYDIVSLTPTRLVVKLDYGWGAWRFTYVSF